MSPGDHAIELIATEIARRILINEVGAGPRPVVRFPRTYALPDAEDSLTGSISSIS